MTGYENTQTDPHNKYIEEVYAAQKDANAAARTVKAYIANGHLEEANQVMEKNKTALAYRSQINAIAKEMGNMHKMDLAIYQSTTMTPDQKREKLNQINQLRIRYLDRVAPILDMVDDY
jgi:hypothetical protein